MQFLKHLTTLFLCAAGISAIPSGYDTSSTPEEHKDIIAARTTPTGESELQFWNSQPGVPSGGLGLGQHLFQGTLPRDTSKDAKLPKILVEGMNAAKANHHYLIGVIVTEDKGPKSKSAAPRKARSVAWDVNIEGTDTMILAKSSTEWKRSRAPTVTYKYIGKAKSDTSPAINKIGMAVALS